VERAYIGGFWGKIRGSSPRSHLVREAGAALGRGAALRGPPKQKLHTLAPLKSSRDRYGDSLRLVASYCGSPAGAVTQPLSRLCFRSLVYAKLHTWDPPWPPAADTATAQGIANPAELLLEEHGHHKWPGHPRRSGHLWWPCGPGTGPPQKMRPIYYSLFMINPPAVFSAFRANQS
jgi:hypothetical protein